MEPERNVRTLQRRGQQAEQITMKNIKTYEGFFDLFKKKKSEDEIYDKYDKLITPLLEVTKPTEAKGITDIEAKKSLGQEIISIVWDRLAKQGVTNADSIIGTRNTIENVDFDKFWSNVTKEDLQNLKKNIELNKQEQLDLYEKFKGAFDPSTGTITNNDTSFFDAKIKTIDAELADLEAKKDAENKPAEAKGTPDVVSLLDDDIWGDTPLDRM